MIAVPPAVLVAIGLATPDLEARAVEWAVARERDLQDGQGLPSAESISRLPQSYRKTLVAVLSPDQRAQVWKNHITRFGPDFATTPEARAFLGSIGALVDEVVLRGNKDRLAFVESEGVRLLGESAFGFLFVDLGPKDGAGRTSEPVAPVRRLAMWLLEGAVVPLSASSAHATCTCAQASDWCGWFSACLGFTGCTPSEWRDPFQDYGGYEPPYWSPGCGTWMQYQCDGDCHSMTAPWLEQ